MTNPIGTSSEKKESPQGSLPAGVKSWEGSSVLVQQGRHWSSALIWISSSLFAAVVLWAFTAKVDQTVSVRGRLQPTGSVQEVDSPSNGVVSKVFVKEDELVTAGQPLLDVEAKGLASRRVAIEQILQILVLQARSFCASSVAARRVLPSLSRL